MSTIGFLHTSPVHTPTFDALVAELGAGVAVVTVVNEGLLADARLLAPDHAEVRRSIERELDALGRSGATVIVCT